MEKDKFVGICKVGEKGQIVIPAQARKMFNIKETFKKDDNSTINDLIIGYIKCVLIKS